MFGEPLLKKHGIVITTRRTGRSFESVARIHGISVEHAKRICRRIEMLEEAERVRITGGTRPIDMGGPRGVWIEELPWEISR